MATMIRHRKINRERMVALFLLGVLAFNAPVLLLFNIDAYVFGIPLFYVYLFAAWAGLIALMRLTARFATVETSPAPPATGDEA
jgi:hypothetical protein